MFPGGQNTTYFSHEEELALYASHSSYLRILGMICIECYFLLLEEIRDVFLKDYNRLPVSGIILVYDV